MPLAFRTLLQAVSYLLIADILTHLSLLHLVSINGR